jgi:hypothetical protein
VFQSYALFPNLTVAENVAFGLVSQRRPAREIKATVAELVARAGFAGSVGLGLTLQVIAAAASVWWAWRVFRGARRWRVQAAWSAATLFTTP